MATRMSRSALLAFALLLGGSLPLACGPASGGPPDPAQEAPRAPQRGGTLVFPGAQPPVTLDPFSGGVGANVNLSPIFEGLVRPAYHFDNGELEDYRIDNLQEPWLAERWDQPDDRTFVFSLRQGVTWQDGRPLTPEDIVFSYQHFMDPRQVFPGSGNLRNLVEDIAQVDDRRIRFSLKSPDADFLENLPPYTVASHLHDRGDDFEKTVTGTGPFRLESFDRVKGMSLARNEGYWREGEPYLERIEIRYGLDVSSRLAALAARQIDFFNIDEKKQFDAIQGVVPDLRSRPVKGPYAYGIRLNAGRPPFNDVRVRRAMNLVYDRQEMLETLTSGLGVINPPGVPGMRTGWAVPEAELLKMPGYRQPKDVDIAEAKRLLAEAGYPNGLKTTISHNINFQWTPLLTEMAANQAGRIGVEINVVGLENAQYVQAQRDSSYDILQVGGGGLQTTPRLWDHYHSKGAWNKNQVSDPRLDDLIERQARTFDLETRKRLLREVQQILYDNAYFIGLVDAGIIVVWQPWLHDYVFNFGNQAYLKNPDSVWLDLAAMPKR